MAVRRRPDKVAILGHTVALLPALSFLFMTLWFHLCLYDADGDVVGPGWAMRLGGASVADWPSPLCLLAGVLCVVLGGLRHRPVTVCEGLWACLAGYVLHILFVFAMF